VRVGGQGTLGQFGQPLAHLRRGLPLVNQSGQVADLVGTKRGGSRRQIHALVPFQKLPRGGEQRVLANVLAKLLISGLIGFVGRGHGERIGGLLLCAKKQPF
jgi:hypothetical protein